MNIVIEWSGCRYEFDGQEWSGGSPDQPWTISFRDYLAVIVWPIEGAGQPLVAGFANAVERLRGEPGVTILEATPPPPPDPQEYRDDVIY